MRKGGAQGGAVMLDVASARKELEEKSLLEIERATATTWAARAAACYDLARDAKDAAGRTARLEEAQNYRQEALEHAAMTEDIPFLRSILKEIQRHQEPADSADAVRPATGRPPRRSASPSRKTIRR